MHTFTNQDTYMVHNYDFNPILQVLETGGLILFPTDTTWSIGCDATHETAVKRLYELKQKGRESPCISLVCSLEMLREYVKFVHPRIETLLIYHERPLTVIYDQPVNLATHATAPDGSAGIRLVKDEFCRQLIEAFGKPLATTSANRYNDPLPRHFGEISSAIIIGVDHVVKHRQLDKEMGEPSVIARLSENEELEFLRE